MKNKLFMFLAGIGVSILTLAATTTSASACIWGAYQPEEPKILREKQ